MSDRANLGVPQLCGLGMRKVRRHQRQSNWSSYADDCHARLRRCPPREQPCCWPYARAFLVAVGALLDSAGRRCAWFPPRHPLRGRAWTSRSLTFARLCVCFEFDCIVPSSSSSPDEVDEVSLVFLLLSCDDIARHSGRDDRWRAGRCIFRALRRYALLFSVPPYQSLTYRTLIL